MLRVYLVLGFHHCSDSCIAHSHTHTHSDRNNCLCCCFFSCRSVFCFGFLLILCAVGANEYILSGVCVCVSRESKCVHHEMWLHNNSYCARKIDYFTIYWHREWFEHTFAAHFFSRQFFVYSCSCLHTS